MKIEVPKKLGNSNWLQMGLPKKKLIGWYIKGLGKMFG